MKLITSLLPAAILCLTVASCDHKDLIYQPEPQPDINVVFDWRDAPDADPESMSLVLYDPAGTTPMRFVFSDIHGGPIALPPGTTSWVCVNGDINKWGSFRNNDDPATAEIYTPDATSLSAYSLETHSIPRAEATENERVAATPGMIWNDRLDNITIQQGDDGRTVTMYPSEGTCHYTVEIDDVGNMEYLQGTNVDATLSGLAEGYLHAVSLPTDTHVTMPLILSKQADGTTLKGEFLTFGVSPATKYPNKLTIYLFLTDGTKWYYTFDATSQVQDASDPHHVFIRFRGLTLPKPLSTGGGFIPNVSDWNTEDIDIQM